MITELRARNFKSWQDTSKLQFAPLTGLFGANSSGKTSILQVLLDAQADRRNAHRIGINHSTLVMRSHWST